MLREMYTGKNFISPFPNAIFNLKYIMIIIRSCQNFVVSLIQHCIELFPLFAISQSFRITIQQMYLMVDEKFEKNLQRL